MADETRSNEILKEEFKWKAPKDIWKGVGIYHITFVVSGRRKLLGGALAASRAYGRSVQHFRDIDENGGVNAGGNSNLHFGARSEIRGRYGGKYTSELATTELSDFAYRVLTHLKELEMRFEDPLNPPKTDNDKVFQICAKQFMPDHLHVVVWVKANLGKTIKQIAQGFRIGVKKIAEDMGVWNQGGWACV